MSDVTLMISSSGQVLVVYRDMAEAAATRDRYNADPELREGQPDGDAPYTTQTWAVREQLESAAVEPEERALRAIEGIELSLRRLCERQGQ